MDYARLWEPLAFAICAVLLLFAFLYFVNKRLTPRAPYEGPPDPPADEAPVIKPTLRQMRDDFEAAFDDKRTPAEREVDIGIAEVIAQRTRAAPPNGGGSGKPPAPRETIVRHVGVCARCQSETPIHPFPENVRDRYTVAGHDIFIEDGAARILAKPGPACTPDELAAMREALQEIRDRRDILDRLLSKRASRSAPVEEQLMLAGRGKRELPTREECAEWAVRLGIPEGEAGAANTAADIVFRREVDEVLADLLDAVHCQCGNSGMGEAVVSFTTAQRAHALIMRLAHIG